MILPLIFINILEVCFKNLHTLFIKYKNEFKLIELRIIKTMKFLLDKNYNTFSESFEISEIENNNSALGWYTFISILLCFSIGIGFNAITIIIGNNNANAIVLSNHIS